MKKLGIKKKNNESFKSNTSLSVKTLDLTKMKNQLRVSAGMLVEEAKVCARESDGGGAAGEGGDEVFCCWFWCKLLNKVKRVMRLLQIQLGENVRSGVGES
nr:hypothetical protein [Tanacetum cinerariifolium]GEZ93528.1 hypothetical protein [Tanacetum cinerariifolium]